jgi:hypothetical protein
MKDLWVQHSGNEREKKVEDGEERMVCLIINDN